MTYENTSLDVLRYSTVECQLAAAPTRSTRSYTEWYDQEKTYESTYMEMMIMLIHWHVYWPKQRYVYIYT